MAEDPYWNIMNMMYGDNPVKINPWSKNDSNSLRQETLIPNWEAIAQSGNLYVYDLNNPVFYFDPSGLWVKTKGLDGNVAFLLRGNAQLLFAFDENGNCGVLLLVGIGVGTPNAGIGPTETIYENLNNIEQLQTNSIEDLGISFGESLGWVALDVGTGITDSDAFNTSKSFAKSWIPLDCHAAISGATFLWRSDIDVTSKPGSSAPIAEVWGHK